MDQESESEDKMWSPRSSQSKSLKKGKEAFCKQSKAVDFAILDYWCWAHSDLLDNTARGVLAEFLVARAVNYTYEPRHGWDSVDVLTKSGIKVEVKSAAYAQSWKQKALSKISFDIAPRKQEWYLEDIDSVKLCPPRRIADVYVFCLLGQPCDPCPDPMDLNQWEFYVLATKTLDRKCPKQKTIALNPLKKLVRQTPEGGATPYGDLAQVIETVGKHN